MALTPQGEKLDPERFVFFFRPSEEHGWMSNWSEHPMREHGAEYKTAEHYLMWHKAMLMGDQESAEKILQAKTPHQAKKLGRKVKNFDDELWISKRKTVMLRGLELKIAQHPELATKLGEMKGKIIAEATRYDRIWGIGYSKDDPRALYMSDWPGANILGKAWTMVRDGFYEA